MIFSHMQKPLCMRICRIGKRICVHGVPLDTSWFCPYCCATVDTAVVTLRGAGSGTRTPVRLAHLSGCPGPSLLLGAAPSVWLMEDQNFAHPKYPLQFLDGRLTAMRQGASTSPGAATTRVESVYREPVAPPAGEPQAKRTSQISPGLPEARIPLVDAPYWAMTDAPAVH
jgi:hypothetical protein